MKETCHIVDVSSRSMWKMGESYRCVRLYLHDSPISRPLDALERDILKQKSISQRDASEDGQQCHHKHLSSL
ncbi:hypothetical protein M378DRAFT_18503 [Amanita muscaria Koide BX008]|uniref:Uncharacterized protein n=1 Tax=Amanita muscaria (strain Koide BX008) TaxID=946122 RepID=A0A0C2WFD8_AMAMK|nr:hypothetical protein M378DRAFT_18503 [Amanita muscaria Koide BX008]